MIEPRSGQRDVETRMFKAQGDWLPQQAELPAMMPSGKDNSVAKDLDWANRRVPVKQNSC